MDDMDILVVPNYPATLMNGVARVKPDQVLFFDRLIKLFNKVTLCADILIEANELHEEISKDKRFIFIALNKYSTKYGFRYRFFTLFKSFFSLIHLVRNQDFVYIFLPGYMGILACIACIITRKQFGVYYRGNLNHAGYIIKRLYCIFSRFAQFSLCTGFALKTQISKAGGNAELVVPMISFNLKEVREYRQTAICVSQFKILYVGALASSKGVIDALECLSTLLNWGYNVKLVLVGGLDLGFKEFFWETVKHLDIAGDIDVPGFVNDKQKLRMYYEDADIFLFPSANEGFPRVVYEAMMFSLPVVMYNLSGGERFMISGENCILVETNKKEKLAFAIQSLVEDMNNMRMIGEKGRVDVLSMMESISFESHSDQVAALIKKKML